MAARYDVVVVGSGSGGGVVASRLSEDPKVRVLLLEAGPDPGNDVPDAVRYVRLGSGVDEYDWNYLDRQTRGALPRGRILGGSSSVNSSFALRGQPQDYDAWAAGGASSWTWAQCLPYFNRLEADREFGELSYHGNSGPIHVEREPLNEFQQLVRSACLELEHAADLHRGGSVTPQPDHPGRRPRRYDRDPGRPRGRRPPRRRRGDRRRPGRFGGRRLQLAADPSAERGRLPRSSATDRS